MDYSVRRICLSGSWFFYTRAPSNGQTEREQGSG